MAFKVSQFTKTVIKSEEPYNLTFNFNKPTALELIQIQAALGQIEFAYLEFNSELGEIKEDTILSKEQVEELRKIETQSFIYGLDTMLNYMVSIEGLEDEDGRLIVVDKPEDLKTLIHRLPPALIRSTFYKFLGALTPTVAEKKS